jgi:putative tricarboxylic transport membrane protein
MDRRIDLVGSLVVTVFGLLVLAVALTYPRPEISYDALGPMGLPFLIGGTLAIAGGIQSYRTARLIQESGQVGFPEGTEDEPEHPSSSRRTLLFMAGAFLYLVGFVTVGYLVATPLAIIGGLWMFSYRTWWKLATVAIGYTLGAFIVFDQILSVPLPTGVLTDLLIELGVISRFR